MQSPDPKVGWNADLYEGKHSFVWRHGADLIELLAPRPGERILDLGCGTGQLTARIAGAGADVVGIDNAPSMIEQARKNFPRLTFEVADARDFHFPEPFDAVFSNAALHWIKEPSSVLASIARSLKPGGRLVAELGAKGNVESIVSALRQALNGVEAFSNAGRDPWYFPTIGEYSTLLEQHGLSVTYAHHFARPTPLEGGAKGLSRWLEMFAFDFLQDLPGGKRREAVQRVEKALRPRLYRDGQWVADYRRLRVKAVKGVLDEYTSFAPTPN
jgi:trans-aconitate 2-methyltransferase